MKLWSRHCFSLESILLNVLYSFIVSMASLPVHVRLYAHNLAFTDSPFHELAVQPIWLQSLLTSGSGSPVHTAFGQ